MEKVREEGGRCISCGIEAGELTNGLCEDCISDMSEEDIYGDCEG
jgi:NMD protein affecting ribosome stability and mRNA decay